MEKMLELLKTAFPKPNIPQKRYLVLVTIVYFILKSYVLSTPATWDDEIPDHLRDAAVTLYAGAPNLQ